MMLIISGIALQVTKRAGLEQIDQAVVVCSYFDTKMPPAADMRSRDTPLNRKLLREGLNNCGKIFEVKLKRPSGTIRLAQR